ncbi:hypothetical protein [Flavobacterium sp. XGLA_31]|uniref:hypothetical protein n=1 Tax=Flavobacterium sp. XGLA_31 TaxID=3447666 RepID=UPI003F3276C4
MKRFYTVYGLLSILLMTLVSCSTDSSQTNTDKFLRKTVDVATDGSTVTTLLNYNGNKIVSMVSENQTVDFAYNGDFITRVAETDLATAHQNILDYSYTDGVLTQITSSDHYVFHFVHHADGTVTYEKRTVDAEQNEVLVYHGVYYFENGNLVKDQRTFDDAGATVLMVKETTYQYDAKKNPLQAVLGFAQLLNYEKNTAVNNVIGTVVTTTVTNLETEEVISSLQTTTTVFKYDGNYPTEMTADAPFLGGTVSNYQRTLFYY